MCAAHRLPSLPFGLVRGAVQKAHFFSPNAENVGMLVADMALLRQCRRQGSWSALQRAWQRVLCGLEPPGGLPAEGCAAA